MDPNVQNLGGLLAERARLSPTREAFAGAGYAYTWAEANERANRFADALRRRGLTRGDRLAILCKNDEQVATALFGAAKIGVITAILNWRLQTPELAYIVDNCGARLLLHDAAFTETAAQLTQDTGLTDSLAVGGEGPGYAEALAEASAAEPELTGGGGDPAVIMYTSGTTGRPKGAVLSHANMVWSSLAISHTIRWNYDHRFLLVAPLFHIGGLAPLVTNVHKGTFGYFVPDFDPVAVWQIIAQQRITTMMSVPLMLQAMYMVSQKMEVDASSLVNITCGASAVPEALIQAYKGLGIEVQQVYGITEFAGAVCFWTHEMGLDKAASQGKPVFHGQVRIVDPATGGDLPAGQVGEVWCGGPMVFQGYWDNPEATAQALTGGWYRSGDLGRVDGDGCVYVVDRLKDMIISGGENIYPAELEKVIAQMDAVAEVAVVGRADDKWGEAPVAFVVPAQGQSPTAEDVAAHCKANLASYKCVKEVRVVEALPKNPVGKVLKTELRQQA